MMIKKLLGVLLAVSLLLCSLSVCAVQNTPYCPGDVDGDGDITAEDVTMLARHVAKISQITNEKALAAGDVDKRSSDLTAEDVTMLARYVAKIISSFDDENAHSEEGKVPPGPDDGDDRI